MMKFYKAALVLLLPASIVSSCSKSDYVIPTTPAQAAYQNNMSDNFTSDLYNWSYTNLTNGSSIYISSGFLYYTYHPTTGAGSGNIQVGTQTSISSSANFV